MSKIGYKATVNLKCESLTYEVGKTYEIDNVEACSHGFHYCKDIKDTLRYYNLKDGLTFIEIEDLGEISTDHGDKSVTNKIKVLRIIPESELDWLKEPIRQEYSYGTWSNKEYDSSGNLIRHEDSIGYWYTKEYDSSGNLIRYEDSIGYWYTNEYDSSGNLIRHEDSDGTWYTNEYDSSGNLIRHEDSYGTWYTKEYDSSGNLIRHENSTGLSWRLTIK